jgi:glycosyltransferase involved in cell wall biosynthesis
LIVNSQFTLDTFSRAGYDTAKARVVGLGAPQVMVEKPTLPPSLDRPLKCLWAGTFSIRKGAHYLLDAWKRVGEGRGLELDVYGAWALPDRFRENLSPSIRFHGSVPQSELFQRYRDADLLVFPTLCDGFGMVIPEAFANGVPVITTDRAGAAELVRRGKNGLIVPAGDAAALAESLEWSLWHRAELVGMRGVAIETARRHPWSTYRRELAEAVSHAFDLPISAC